MAIQDERLTVTVKQNPNNKVTVKTKENLGVNAVTGDSQVGARTLGIPGKEGDIGPEGPASTVPGPIGPVGMVWQGEYNVTAVYQQRDGVEYAGSSYIYIYGLPTSGNAPPDPTYWDLLAGGATGGDLSYVHVQGAASMVWTVIHNLGKFPSITVVDSANTEVEGEVIFIDPATIEIRFSAAFGGRAYCN